MNPDVTTIWAVALIFAASIVFALMLFMRPKRFYFIRHGQTLLNKQHIKQGAEGALSEEGKQQAVQVGAILKPLGIKKIITSPYERAKETSSIINQMLGVSIDVTPLLAERRNPSEVIGKRRDDPEVVRIVDTIDLTYHDDDYRYSDEENFDDLKQRAKECLHYLEKRGASSTCVVTHHAFLKMVLAYSLYRENLHAGDFIKLSFFNVSDNGGISIMEYHPWRRLSATRGWSVVSFNETLGGKQNPLRVAA